MTEPNPHALTGAYALDALDGEEYAQFQAHLSECDSCPTEAAELRVTAARLFDLVERTPPADLRARVLAAVDRTAQLPPLPVSLDSRRIASRRRTAVAAGSIFALAAVTAGALFVGTLDDSGPGGDVPSAAQILAADDARPIIAAPGALASAQVVVSDSLDAAVLQLSDMPTPEEGKTYQAWIFEGDAVIPADTFEPSADGVVTRVLEHTDDATGFGITIEDDGGSDNGVPTLPPVIQFDLGA